MDVVDRNFPLGSNQERAHSLGELFRKWLSRDIFPLLIFWGCFFLFFNISSSWYFHRPPSPHNHVDIERSLSAPLGRSPRVAAAGLTGRSVPIAVLILHVWCPGSHVAPSAILVCAGQGWWWHQPQL